MPVEFRGIDCDEEAALDGTAGRADGLSSAKAATVGRMILAGSDGVAQTTPPHGVMWVQQRADARCPGPMNGVRWEGWRVRPFISVPRRREIFHSRHDGGGRHAHGRDAGAGKKRSRDALERCRSRIQRGPCVPGGALFVYLRGGATDDIIDFGVSSDCARQCLEHGGAEMLRVQAARARLCPTLPITRRLRQASMIRLRHGLPQ